MFSNDASVLIVDVNFIDASFMIVFAMVLVVGVEVVDWKGMFMSVLNNRVVCIGSLLDFKDWQVDFVQNMNNASRMLHCSK